MTSTTTGSGAESKREKGVAKERDQARPSQPPLPEQPAQGPEQDNARPTI